MYCTVDELSSYEEIKGNESVFLFYTHLLGSRGFGRLRVNTMEKATCMLEIARDWK